MHELELLNQQLIAHLELESDRIQRLKDLSGYLQSNGTAENEQLQTVCDGIPSSREGSEHHNQQSYMREIDVGNVFESGNRNLLSNLGQYQAKRDEFVKERKREYQEYLKQQEFKAQRKSPIAPSANRRLEIIEPCQDRNKLDEERKRFEEEKYREELKKQIEENRRRRETERQHEMYARRRDELRSLREANKMAGDMARKEQPTTFVEEMPIDSNLESLTRSPSYLHVNEPRKIATPIRLRPLLEAFARSPREKANVQKERSPVIATLSHVRNKMLHDHKELMNKIQNDFVIN